MRNALPPLVVPNLDFDDCRVWTLSSNGEFTISSLWNKLRPCCPKVDWSHLVWFPAHIPKCSVISWVAILGRLSTEVRLVLFGIKPTSCCSLCNGSESHDHLFFNCPFSCQVWNSISANLNVSWAPQSWSNWILMSSSFRGNSLWVSW